MLGCAVAVIHNCPVPVPNLMAATAAVWRRSNITGAGQLVRAA